MLTEGNSMRATSRMADVSINTVTKLLVDVGSVCAAYQRETLRNLPCKQLRCDEIWSFCCSKEKDVPKDKQHLRGYGDIWTWTAVDPDTKLVPSWLVGMRDAYYAGMFMRDLASRLANRVQITSERSKVLSAAIPTRAHLDEFRRAPESHDADEHAPVYAAHKRIQQESGAEAGPLHSGRTLHYGDVGEMSRSIGRSLFGILAITIKYQLLI